MLNIKRLIPAFIAALVVGGITAGLAYLLDQPMLEWAFVAALLALPLALALLTKRRRWLVAAGINLILALTLLAGGFVPFFAATVASLLTFVFSGVSLREIHGGSRRAALQNHVAACVGVKNEIQIIEQGRTAVPAKPGVLLGPRQLIVKPNNAVVIEQGRKITRIEGPTITQLAEYEYVREIYDLRTKEEQIPFGDVLSRDLLPTSFSLQTRFRINIADNFRTGEFAFGAPERAVIRQIDLHTRDWVAATRSAIEQAVRLAAGGLALQTLLDPANHPVLGGQIFASVQTACAAWNVVVEQIALIRVSPSQQVTEASSAQWVATSDAFVSRSAELARAQGMREALQLIAQGYATAKSLGMSETDIHRETLRRTLEEIAKDPSLKILMIPELKDLWDRL